MPPARLATVADAQRQQLALPVEVRAFQLTIGGLQLAEARQAGEQISRAAEDFLQVFGGIGRDLAAEAASGHVQENLPADLAQVDCPGRHIQQRQGLGRFQRHTGGLGKIIGGAQWHQHQAGVALGLGHGFGHVAQGAVAAAGNNVGIPAVQGLLDQPLSVTALPGHPHRQLPTLLAPGQHRRAHVLVEGLLAVEDQQCLGGGHGGRTPGFNGA
ncbi:hypothetical protein PS664_05913 [Pseudomonas fluorescens]|nr:hypothetical protein PS664_05913 [Pseudomonas fluorescens]